MSQPSPAPERIRFDIFEADVRSEELFKSGSKVRLPHQSFRVLAMLLERPAQLITREEFQAKLWPADTLVEYDRGLNAAINRLREALGDSAESPRFIETLPKRGYRFIATIHSDILPASPLAPDQPNELSAPGVAAAPRVQELRARRKLLVIAVAAVAALVLIAGSIAILTSRSAMRAPPARQLIPLTSLPGQEVAPTFSPDGSQLAFAWNGGAGNRYQFDLYVKSLGSQRLLRLTHDPSKWISPAWSPDGTFIAFVRVVEGNAGIFVIPALGGTERRIVSDGVAIGSHIQISWSADGRSLAYSAYGPTGVPQVFIVRLDTLNTQPLSPAPDCRDAGVPAFSPDGKQLVFICISSTAEYKVYVAALPDGPMRALVSVMGYPRGLAWSTDGRHLILSNDPGDGGELWQLSLDGQLQQFPFGESGTAPAVAARGGRMAYVRQRANVDIWRVDLTADHPQESATRLIYSTRLQMLPAYSRDGLRIAFQSNRSGSREIWMTDAQGNNLEQLTSLNLPLNSAPSWCSDGRRLAFDSHAAGTSAVYIEDISERVPRKVVTSRNDLSSPAWSEDCRWLFASDGKHRLYRFASSGGTAELFTELPSSYRVVVGDQVVFNVRHGEGQVLWIKPVGGGREAPLENMPTLSYADSWAATATGVYYTDSSSTPVRIEFYEFASRTTRLLMTLKDSPPPGGGPAITVSPDGRWLLYAQPGEEQSEIILAAGQ